jgi:hypothetical protein
MSDTGDPESVRRQVFDPELVENCFHYILLYILNPLAVGNPDTPNASRDNASLGKLSVIANIDAADTSGRQATASSATLVSAWLQVLSRPTAPLLCVRASERPQSEHGPTARLVNSTRTSASALAASRTAHAVDDTPDYILISHHRFVVDIQQRQRLRPHKHFL